LKHFKVLKNISDKQDLVIYNCQCWLSTSPRSGNAYYWALGSEMKQCFF